VKHHKNCIKYTYLALAVEPHILIMLQKNRESVTIESGVKSEFKIKKRIKSADSSGQLMGWKQNEEG